MSHNQSCKNKNILSIGSYLFDSLIIISEFCDFFIENEFENVVLKFMIILVFQFEYFD